VYLFHFTNFVIFTNFYCFRASTIITDLLDFVPLMNLNIEANKTIFQMDVEARELKWGSEISSKDSADIDVVVVADCIYYEEV